MRGTRDPLDNEPFDIAHVSEVFAPGQGGIETALQTLIAAMPEFRTLVLTVPYPGQPRTSWFLPHCRVERIPPNFVGLAEAMARLLPANARSSAGLAVHLTAFLERERRRRQRTRTAKDIKLVHLHSLSQWTRLASLEDRRTGLPMHRILRWLGDFGTYGRPVVFTDHSLFGGPEEQFEATYGPELVRRLRRIVCVEESGLHNVRRCIQDEGLDIDLRRIPNPIDTAQFRPRPLPPMDRLIVGYAGRAAKAGLDLVVGLAGIAPRWLQIRTALAVPGWSERPSLPPGVDARWNLPPSEMAGFYGSVHVTLDPYTFGLPRTTLEALACGRPVVRVRENDTDPLPDRASPVVRGREPEEVLHELKLFRAEPQLLEESAGAARTYAVETHSVEHVACAYRSLYAGATDSPHL